MSSVQNRVNTMGGFRGCVQSLIFNQQQYDFRKATQHMDIGLGPTHGKTHGQLGQNVSIDAELGDAVDGQNIGRIEGCYSLHHNTIVVQILFNLDLHDTLYV